MLVDPRLLRHIVMNLLSNAQKYSSANRLPEVTVEYLPEEVNIRVKDFGIGIPADEIQHLFTSFYRASNTENIQGTGLGLVIVKQLVDMHGGSVHVESTFGSGSEFIVNLPKQHIQNEESTSC
jgi:signal transduction histidine kinase